MKKTDVVIIGAGPYGLSIAAHLAARRIEHRIFGRPMQFWSQIAAAGARRFLKSYCFGTDISTPKAGFRFADFSRPRGLETFEPCSIGQFADYGHWFQQQNVPWVEPVDVAQVECQAGGFGVRLEDGERLLANQVVVATGLSHYAQVPEAVASLPSEFCTHTSKIRSFSEFQGRDVAIIGAGQSALEAAALLHESGARPLLLVRDEAIRWHSRSGRDRSLWQRLRYPISKLGAGPKAWALTHFPGAVHRFPEDWRTRFVARHLPAEGAWWLRERVENVVPVRLGVTVQDAQVSTGKVVLHLRGTNGSDTSSVVDHMIAGSGYRIDVDRLEFLHAGIRSAVERSGLSPKLDGTFQSSVPGLRFVGVTSAVSFGPLFRFVVGAEYTAHVIARSLAARRLPRRLPVGDPSTA